MTEGSPAYRAAVTSAAVFDGAYTARLRVLGRAPGQMLKGILTGTLPCLPTQVAEGLVGGRATYHAVLTPKGKMITDLWCSLPGGEEDTGFHLDVPAAGRDALLAHLGRFLPPRLAKVEDVSEASSSLTVVGPEAAFLLTRLALGLRVEATELSALPEGEWRSVGPAPAEGLMVTRTADVWPEAHVVRGPRGAVDALARALEASGVVRGDADAWSTLRVEAGRPAWGVDMDGTTIPVEADIHERAIDYTKGCYTGQEVIVRIRDQGHVNRTLRLVRLGDVEPPASGAELFEAGASEDARAAAVVRSAVRSPRYGETVALAYVKRGVEGALTAR